MKRAVHSFVIAILLVLVVVLTAVAVNPEWRRSVQNWFFSDKRVVLATVRGRFIAGEEPLKAVKARDSRGVFVDVFKELPNGDLQLIDTVYTGHPEDGQFNFKGQVSRLVASDIDQDGVDELLVPTFDQERNPRLNLFKYQPSMKEFQFISPPKSSE